MLPGQEWLRDGAAEDWAAEDDRAVRLLGPADVRAAASGLGLRPRKGLGQNFVVDPNTVRRVVRLAGVVPGERVLEIGAGLGSLTLALAAAGASVFAVEVDPTLAAALPTLLAARGAVDVDVVLADAVRLTPAELPTGAPPTVVVANLPYNVSVPVLLRILDHFPSIRRGLVMVQAEVAARLCSGPGSRVYGVPSVKAAWWARLSVVGDVPRTVFWPQPHVDSALVALQRRPQPGAEELRRVTFDAVNAAFAQRRKALRGALAGWAGSAGAAERLLRTASIDPGARGETLSVDQFARLGQARLEAELLGLPGQPGQPGQPGPE